MIEAALRYLRAGLCVLPAVRWAWRFVDYQTRRMLFMAGQHVAEGYSPGS